MPVVEVAAGQPGDDGAAEPDRRGQPGRLAGTGELTAPRRDHQAAHQRVGRDAVGADRLLVDRGERAGDARAEPGPDRPPGRPWQQPVKRGYRGVPVRGPDQQQPARLERAKQPVEHQLDVLHAVKQQGAVDHVVGALRDRDGPQVAGDDVVVGACGVAQHPGRQRVVGVDGGDRDVETAFGQLVKRELAQRGQAARLEHAHRLAQVLQHVIADRLGEKPALRALAGRLASFGSRHVTHSN